MNIKVITAGKCMLCGQEIKIIARRGGNNLPNIFFCPECEKQMQAQRVMKAESEGKKDVNFASKVLVQEEIANKCPVIMKFIAEHKVRNEE